VKTKQFDVRPMSIEEAALQMELLGHDFYLFTLAESGTAAVVYRRRDGELGLIEASS
jgi:putative sigma-54 modulation protein